MGLRDGIMGKFAIIAAGLLALLGSAHAEAGNKSKVKTAKLVVTKSTKHKVHTAKKRARAPGRSLVTPPLAELNEIEEGLSPFGSKFVSKRVQFAASQGPVPESYDCDGRTEETKKQEAEREALAKCEASGEKYCRVHRSVIVKNGELKCGDVPGRSCKRKEFIRGCVARAIAVGGEAPEAAAAAF